ncbi:hypothetical protein U1Q18_002310, partial [Sarracenia purpurea var. burkii]
MAASSPEKELRRKVESFNNLESRKNSFSKNGESNYQERFAEERDTGVDEDLGKLTNSNENRRGGSYLQEGDPNIEGRPLICCQKEGYVAFGPKFNRGPAREAICGIKDPMNPVGSSPLNKNKWPNLNDKIKSLNLEGTRDKVGEPNLYRARNWKRRAREQEVRSKSKERAIVIAAEVGEKKRKSCSNGAAVEEQTDGKKLCCDMEIQRTGEEKQ